MLRSNPDVGQTLIRSTGCRCPVARLGQRQLTKEKIILLNVQHPFFVMSKGLNRFAIFVACATFFLIIAGALVTSHDAGLATSDWPLSNGQVFPKMVGNLFWEHGHRMVATTVGMLTIALFIIILIKERRSRVRKLGLFALLAVIAQGLLGGLTVKLMLPLVVSAAHATLAQLFFCTTVSLAVFTSRSWIEARPMREERDGPPLRYLGTAAVVTIFLQLIIGATLRHSATWDRPLPVELGAGTYWRRARSFVGMGCFLDNGFCARHRGEKFLNSPGVICRFATGGSNCSLVLAGVSDQVCLPK